MGIIDNWATSWGNVLSQIMNAYGDAILLAPQLVPGSRVPAARQALHFAHMLKPKVKRLRTARSYVA